MKNKKPFFSIIIPTFNEENFIPKLLTDLIKQTDKNFEIIVSDNFSQDKTKKVVLSFKSKLPINFYLYKGKNVAAQRNFGAIKSSGEYLIFLDADTRINQSFVKKLKNVIKIKKGLVFIPYSYPQETKIFPEMKFIFPILNSVVEFSQIFGKAFSAGGNMVWEKNFFKRVGGFDESLDITEDHDIIRKAHKWGVKVNVLKEVSIKFSLRRMKKEGRLSLFYKTFISHLYLSFNEKLRKKLFEYNMGGHIYKDLSNNKNLIIFKKKDLLKKIKNSFKYITK